MQGHTHALFGVTTMAAVNYATGFVQPHIVRDIPTGAAVCAGAAIFGALLPDIDANESTIKNELGLAGKIFSGILRLVGVKHRGLTHWGITALAVVVAAVALGNAFGWPDAGLAFGLGYLSHILPADAMTISGVPLLWPREKAFHLLPGPLRVRTGGPVEMLVFLCLAICLAFLLPDLMPDELMKLIGRF